MRSKEPNQTQSLRVLLEDPEIQRRAHSWAERLVQRYNLAPMTGEDLYQEAMTKLVRYANSEEPREINYPQAFFYKVLHNRARTQARNQASFNILHIEAVEYEEVPIEKLSDNFDMVQRIESGILLAEAFRSLDEQDDRDLFICIINHYTMRQIGALFNISHVAAAERVKVLIKKIQKALF